MASPVTNSHEICHKAYTIVREKIMNHLYMYLEPMWGENDDSL